MRMTAQARGARVGDRVWSEVRASAAWRLLRGTVGACLRYRVTGLAAEGAFFAILSLPPLVFGLAGSIGYVVGGFGSQTVEGVKAELIEVARGALTEDSIQHVIIPTLDAVLDRGRADVISIGFVLALWSGSRALNVFIDTIAIMHGLGGRRGIVKTRVLSFSLYVVALGMAVLVMPLVLAGPAVVDTLVPERFDFLNAAYWPAVVVLSTAFLTTLYHLAVPKRTPWRHDFTGAVVAMLLWVGGSFVLRWTLFARHREHLDLRSAGGADRRAPLALPHRDLVADRCRVQRDLPPAGDPTGAAVLVEPASASQPATGHRTPAERGEGRRGRASRRRRAARGEGRRRGAAAGRTTEAVAQTVTARTSTPARDPADTQASPNAWTPRFRTGTDRIGF